jgi:hypothetical protein
MMVHPATGFQVASVHSIRDLLIVFFPLSESYLLGNFTWTVSANVPLRRLSSGGLTWILPLLSKEAKASL